MTLEQMKHLKLIIRKIQTLLRYHFSPARLAKIWKHDNISPRWGCGEIGALVHLWGGCHWYLLVTACAPAFLPATPHPEVHLEDKLPTTWRYIWTRSCIAASFVTATFWKLHTCFIGQATAHPSPECIWAFFFFVMSKFSPRTASRSEKSKAQENL